MRTVLAVLLCSVAAVAFAIACVLALVLGPWLALATGAARLRVRIRRLVRTVQCARGQHRVRPVWIYAEFRLACVDCAHVDRLGVVESSWLLHHRERSKRVA